MHDGGMYEKREENTEWEIMEIWKTRKFILNLLKSHLCNTKVRLGKSK